MAMICPMEQRALSPVLLRESSAPKTAQELRENLRITVVTRCKGREIDRFSRWT
jgi:hypothetical protein